jgi:CHAT domain
MSVSLYEQAVRSAQREIERQRKKQTDETKAANKADAEALRYERDAERTSSTSTARMKLDNARRKRDAAQKCREKAAAALTALGKAETDLASAKTKLDQARAKEQKRQQDKEDRARQQAERRRQERERQAERERQRRESEQQRELASLRSQVAQTQASVAAAPWANAPERVTVLFVAASPEDQEPLRLGQEVREIQHRVRESAHRDQVDFEWRPAARVTDLMQMLLEVRPHIVHFSGHGSQGALAFEDADGMTKPLTNDQLAALLHATSDRIRLAVFNSCDSAEQAQYATLHLDAAIGMNEPVEDEAAKVFAGQFYNSLGFGQSLAQAFEQAHVHVELRTGSSSGEPKLYTAGGVDPAELYLVAPPT